MLVAGHRMGLKRARLQMAQAEAYQQQGAQKAVAQQPAARAAGPGTEDVIAQIERLSALHQSGALTDEEFAAAKAKLLGWIPSLSSRTGPIPRIAEGSEFVPFLLETCCGAPSLASTQTIRIDDSA